MAVLFGEVFPQKHQAREGARIYELEVRKSVTGEYGIRFEIMLNFSQYYHVHLDEEWVCRRFEDGLRPDLKRAMLPLKLNKFPALVENLQSQRGITRREQFSHDKRVPDLSLEVFVREVGVEGFYSR